VTAPLLPGSDANGMPNGLEGDQRDAYVALLSVFKQYGLDTLAPKILDYIQQGYSADTLSYLLQQTPEFKQRFAGNEARAKAGLPVLSPADYLSTESAYRQIMQQAGLPQGFYDQPSDFASWIGADVAPTEVKSRVDLATQYTQGLDQSMKDALLQYHGLNESDVAAYFLDQKRALPLLQKQSNAIQIGAAGIRQGLGVSAADADYWAGRGVTPDQAQQGFGQAAQVLPTAERLGKIYGSGYSQNTAEREFLGDQADARAQRLKLAQQEQENFAGGYRSFSTTSSNSLNSDSGQY
jgi:hypothetical protein